MMGRTIIQPIGPLYGEAVNGTVFGRPNGSIYVPSTNKIMIKNATEYITNVKVGEQYRLRFSTALGAGVYFDVVAEAQDQSSYMRLVVATDSDLSTIVTQSPDTAAGMFNLHINNIVGDYQVTVGNTYYVAALLLNNGEAIATSDIYEVTAV